MSGTSRSIAEIFVAAHRDAVALDGFPGTLPETLGVAYAIQDEAIALWPDRIAGWKVARIAPDCAAVLGADRWIGPVFRGAIVRARPGTIPFPIIAGGGGALEGEIMFVLGTDVPPRDGPWTPQAARALVGAVHIGIEVAGSAFVGNSALGPIAMICGLGNTIALIVGPRIAIDPNCDIPCTVTIDGRVAGAKVVDGALRAPLEALALVLDAAGARGFPLRCGQIVSTGAITGAHTFAIGQHGRVDFGRFGGIDCRGVAALPRVPDQPDAAGPFPAAIGLTKW